GRAVVTLARWRRQPRHAADGGRHRPPPRGAPVRLRGRPLWQAPPRRLDRAPEARAEILRPRRTQGPDRRRRRPGTGDSRRGKARWLTENRGVLMFGPWLL